MDQLDEFEVAALQVRTAASVLRQAADDIAGLQRRLDAAVNAAVGLGLRVDATGRVTAPDMGPAERHDPDGQLAQRR